MNLPLLNFISLMHWLQKPYKNALIVSQNQAGSMVHFYLLLKENMLRNITQSHSRLAVILRLGSFSSFLTERSGKQLVIQFAICFIQSARYELKFLLHYWSNIPIFSGKVLNKKKLKKSMPSHESHNCS